MASFWPRFKISSLFVPKDNSSNSLVRKSSLTSMIVKENVRNFWFNSKQKSVEFGSGNCGQPPLPKIKSLEPCKGCPSKCIEPKPKRRFFFFKKKSVHEKPSNCVVKKHPEMKLTLWEEIFGPDPKRFWPDPCSCRVANRQKKAQRQKDPRLSDPRYRETAGDVFLYTQLMKQCRKCCLEPQPKPPPAFKLPKAVLFRMIGEGCHRKPFEEITDGQEMEHNVQKMSSLRKCKLPYDEMRPTEKIKKSFTCREGIRPQDVQKPFNEELDFVKVFPKVRQVYTAQSLRTREDILPESSKTQAAVSGEGSNRRSRIEQLKMLVQQKNHI